MTIEATKTLTVLWIRGDEPGAVDLHTLLGAQARITAVESFDRAAEALHRASFDLIVGSPEQFQPADRPHLVAEAAAILETVTQGVGIVGEDGQLVWANPKMLSFSDELRDEVCRLGRETFAWASSEAAKRPSQVRGRRFSVHTDDKRSFEITATPVIDLNNRVTQVAAVVLDATNALRLQERIDAIDAAGRELVRLDVDQITRLNAHERLGLLEQKVIRYTRELMHIDNFAVRVRDPKTNRLELVLSSGMSNDAQNLDLFISNEGNGISGYVAQRGRSYICPDVHADGRYLPGIEAAASSLTVPLRLHDQVIGIFNVESTRPAAFGEDDRQILEIFARHAAISLHMLELLVTERSTAKGKLGSDVMAEITAPLNDIVTEVGGLIEDYIGHDDLRHRLNKISANAVTIRDSIKQVTMPQRGLVGRRPAGGATRSDPVLKDKRVLIVDDEEVIRQTVRDVLVSYGCEVTVAADGRRAIDLLEADPFDLVLSDIKMPEASGYEVFAASKDADADRPVILMTGFGYDPNHSIVRARREGLAAVLFKPFKVDQLLGEIRNALRSAPTGG
ncbi:MAG: response regulator [bacterium]|nr:response regulator [bacterium]